MLNEHLSYDLLKEEMIRRDWLLQNVQRDDGWKGGTLIVPFQGSHASSAKWGGLSGQADIDQPDYIRGQVTSQKELWGSILFNHRDLIEHDGRVSEKSFLRVLPEVLDDHMTYIKERSSLNMLNGSADNAAADGTAGGLLKVKHPERFTIGEKVFVDDDNSGVSPVGYVTNIDMNTGELTIFDARSAGAAVDLSAYTVAQNAKVYFDGTEPGTDNGFTSLRSQILSAANGGSASLFGQTKTAYPFLQSIQVDGSGITASNILDRIFAAYVKVLNRSSGRPTKVVMSYKNYAAVMQNLELGKGQYHIDQKSRNVTSHGWSSINVLGAKGELELVAVQEQDDDLIYYLDTRGVKFHSNGFFRKRVAPDGKSYFEIRAAAGFSYVVDILLFGELVVNRPSAQGVLHSVDFSLDGTDDMGA
jgi:hypothetical protein